MNDLLEPVRKKFETPEMKKLINGAYPPPVKVKPGKGGAGAAAAGDESKPSRLDIRIGKIVEVSKHPDAESLYIEKIDLNEEGGTRTIVSGKDKSNFITLLLGKKNNVRFLDYHRIFINPYFRSC